ncbi:hypothetical protein R6Q57_018825 [Mikania cordata]
MAATAFHISRRIHHVSNVVSPPSTLHHTTVMLDEKSFNASRIMGNFQEHEHHHKVGGLEELMMGCTPSSTDLKEVSFSLPF